MATEIFNPNPAVFSPVKSSRRDPNLQAHYIWLNEIADDEEESDQAEEIDQAEIYELVRNICDPEHPNTLEELRVVSAPQITITKNNVHVEFTPTVPHCGMSTLIGLSIRVRLLRSLPNRFKVDINVKPGSHSSELAVNRQLNDKERVAAALENPVLLENVERCLAGSQI